VQAYSLQGYSVAVDENTAVVGAPALEQSTSDVVSIYDAATGALLHTLSHPNSDLMTDSAAPWQSPANA